MKTKIIALLMIIALVITVCTIMSGCGDKKTDATEAATTAATEAATTAADIQNGDNNNSDQNNDQQNNDQQSNDQQNNNQQNNDQQSGDGNNTLFAGISEADASSKALANVDGGNIITIVEKGSYNGADCWQIGVETTTGTLYECYVSADFCYVSEIQNDDSILQENYAGTSAQAAGITAVEAAGGEGWKIVDYSKSSYNGQDAWYVTVQNDDGTVKNCFVIGCECYFE